MSIRSVAYKLGSFDFIDDNSVGKHFHGCLIRSRNALVASAVKELDVSSALYRFMLQPPPTTAYCLVPQSHLPGGVPQVYSCFRKHELGNMVFKCVRCRSLTVRAASTALETRTRRSSRIRLNVRSTSLEPADYSRDKYIQDIDKSKLGERTGSSPSPSSNE